MKIATFDTLGMQCPACPKLIDLKLERLPGVTSAESDLLRHRTTVVFDEHLVDASTIADTIHGTGFDVAHLARRRHG